MAVERTYYTIDPEGKLTCMKCKVPLVKGKDRKSTRLNSSHANESRMPSSA